MDKDKFYNTVMIVFGCFLGMAIIGIGAMAYSDHQTRNKIVEQKEELFYKSCENSCYPNGVYSTKYNRCMCNASVTVREIK